MDRNLPDYEDTLRRLTLNDERFVRGVLARPSQPEPGGALEPRVDQLVRLGALIGLDAGDSTISAAVSEALVVGASREDVVAVLVSVGPSIGSTRMVAIAPRIADALGFDVMGALERLNGHRS